ncbi:uncharacterized protein G2W53_007428 [Senna tora]|uniref:Uncharacterized protein n=1 Tax=Senna tora TaxID=362788 RepID=A0A835CDM9_9FABA|nr:uncharacterized protein G2W53_007428 [Senna tora]
MNAERETNGGWKELCKCSGGNWQAHNQGQLPRFLASSSLLLKRLMAASTSLVCFLWLRHLTELLTRLDLGDIKGRICAPPGERKRRMVEGLIMPSKKQKQKSTGVERRWVEGSLSIEEKGTVDHETVFDCLVDENEDLEKNIKILEFELQEKVSRVAKATPEVVQPIVEQTSEGVGDQIGATVVARGVPEGGKP